MSQLPENEKVKLIRTFLPQTTQTPGEPNLKDYETYFDAFDAELKFLNTHRTYIRKKFVATAEQLAEIFAHAVPVMQKSPDANQDSILDDLRKNLLTTHHTDAQWESFSPDPEVGEKVLELALDSVIRLWLMTDPSPEDEQGGGDNTGWRGQRQLCDFVYAQFYPCRQPPSQGGTQGQTTTQVGTQGQTTTQTQVGTQGQTPGHNQGQADDLAAETTQVQSNLTHPLTAANMKKLTNINVEWVNDLGKHLLFNTDTRKVSVFPHNRWLFDALSIIQDWEKQLPRPQLCPFPIPLEVIEETIKSLNLLFPPYNEPTNNFLKNSNKSLFEFRLSGHGHARDRAGTKVRLREFSFYHDRLIELAQEFINPPKDWYTIFRDYRNPIQYWTFWLGLVIFIATLASVGLGGVQVYYAQKAAP